MAFATQCKNCGQLAATDSGTPILPAHPSNADRRPALAKIKSQIDLYEKSIAALEEQADQLEDALAQTIYPVLSLPTEITSTIFVHCLPPHGRVKPSSSRAPLLLAQICHDWREIALATCALWTSFYFRNYRTYRNHGVERERENRTTSLLQTWLSRAKASPLSLGLDYTFRNISQQLLGLVLSCAGQIQRLDLHLNDPQFREFHPLQVSFPHLQHLALTRWTDPELAEFLHRTPSLRELRLLNHAHEPPADLCLPHLTYLEISTEISTTTLLCLLQNCPLLTTVHFKLRESDTPPESEHSGSSPTSPNVFLNLSALVLDSRAAVGALRFLTLPALRQITIPLSSDWDVVSGFITRSTCTIEQLTIFSNEYEERGQDHTGRWLPVFPGVTVLHVKECPDVDDLLDWLEPGELMPHLEELTLHSTLCREQNYDAGVITLLHNRQDLPECTALRKLHMQFSTLPDRAESVWETGPLGNRAMRELEQFIAGGLDYVFFVDGGPLDSSITWPDTYVAPDPLPLFP
ncbi:hypothetical protein C8R46DRAFT_1353335 [Mycena filopes]|nr:hypothetical protein C8R46DRAFT_1353335 [Mycena filopes]